MELEVGVELALVQMVKPMMLETTMILVHH